MSKPRPIPTTGVPAPRVIHYVTPAVPADVAHLTPAQIEDYQARYVQWRFRQAAIAERDRRARMAYLGFGVTAGLGVLGALSFAVWQIVHAVSFLGVLAIPAVLLLAGGALWGGHRCITVIQHWH
ncbi:hypothetical protein [Catenuloplanes atrovinosus]|uniref:Uncharacterized protein n=1 Tax=Catenuloplanes atrovinosus TaxID=137266 RepID=A0AAE3YK20_9ACTN|nr:hypothetical protein [Catenuloplanes atrovinosus]MDR7273603.1 hypothetical protein [Catenuloplanes atrovinosus]